MRQLIIMVIFTLMMQSPDSDAQEVHYTYDKVIFPRQKLVIKVEIAKTEKQRVIGLMGREHLAANNGMLFIFEQQAIQRVWMKKTSIPLDVIFISAKGRVVYYFKYLQPCENKVCTIYESVNKAKFMLEVNAGVIDHEDIKIGDVMK